MITDPNATQVELAAAELGPLLDDLVLVGGCAVGMLIDDPASPTVRPTVDVDVIIEVAPATEYYEFCKRMRDQGFVESQSEVICRWKKGKLMVDVMPIDPEILGFTNSWYQKAMETAKSHVLPNGLSINVISPALFVATKMESFLSRGGGDYLHHDIEDIINVINGRAAIVSEVHQSDSDVRDYLRDEFDTLLADETFIEQLTWHLAHEADRIDVVIARMRAIAGI